MSTVEERTAAFYAWERRGRGWWSHACPVALEPPFVPFLRSRLQGRTLDDARKDTLLSSLVGSFLGGKDADQVPGEVEVTDELPEPFERTEPPREIWVTLPTGEKWVEGAGVGWLQSLTTCSEPVSFEMEGLRGKVRMRLACSALDEGAVLGTLRAYYPSVVVLDAAESFEERWRGCPGEWISILEFGLGREFMVPLSLPPARPDPLTPLVGALAELEQDEMAVVQVLFEAARMPWGEQVARAVLTPSGQPFFADAPEVTRLAGEKFSAAPFAVVLRIAVKAADFDDTWRIVRRVAGGLAQFGSPSRNELIPLAGDDLDLLEEDLLSRTTHRSGMLWSLAELAALVHLPSETLQVPGFVREVGRSKAAPEAVTGNDGVLLGDNAHRGVSCEVRLRLSARMRHVHIVGASGTGKSTLLVSLILQDIERGYGVGVLDPHGDLIDEVLGRVPPSRVDDVVVFDPADAEYVVGWNMLAASSEVEKEVLASDLVAVFRRLSTSWGDQMTAVLDTAILTFLDSTVGGTLQDLRRFLLEKSFREEFLSTVRDPHLVSFWQSEYQVLSRRRAEVPILTRLNTLLRSSLVRRIVTEKERQFDLRELVDGGRIFLAKLSQGLIGEENAALLGSLLVSKFHQATLMRQTQEPEERRPFLLYVDEVHHVATPSMGALFSGARKYQMGVVVAHQDLYQLHSKVPDVERAILANAHSRICFRVADEDARSLERGFSSFTAADLTNLETGEALCRVGRQTDDFNLATRRLPALDRDAARANRDAVSVRSREQWARRLREEELRPPVRETPEVARERAPEPPPPRPKEDVSRPSTPETPAAPTLPGRGGPEHKYLQELISRWARERGFKASVELDLDEGGRVDVALERGEKRLACEIAVESTIEQEIHNIEKCLAAGFDTVAAVSLKKPFLRRLKEAVEERLSEEDAAKVELYTPEELLSRLADEPILEAEDSVAGYKVRVRYTAPEHDDQEARSKAVSKVILKRLRQMRGKKP